MRRFFMMRKTLKQQKQEQEEALLKNFPYDLEKLKENVVTEIGNKQMEIAELLPQLAANQTTGRASLLKDADTLKNVSTAIAYSTNPGNHVDAHARKKGQATQTVLSHADAKRIIFLAHYLITELAGSRQILIDSRKEKKQFSPEIGLEEQKNWHHEEFTHYVAELLTQYKTDNKEPVTALKELIEKLLAPPVSASAVALSERPTNSDSEADDAPPPPLTRKDTMAPGKK